MSTAACRDCRRPVQWHDQPAPAEGRVRLNRDGDLDGTWRVLPKPDGGTYAIRLTRPQDLAAAIADGAVLFKAHRGDQCGANRAINPMPAQVREQLLAMPAPPPRRNRR